MAKIIVQAHRGGGVAAPENTIETFVETWEGGIIPEADLRTTRDGVIVAFHDANFARVVKNASAELQQKSIRDLTFDEIAALDVGSSHGDQYRGQRVRRVEELFEELQKDVSREIYLDIKEQDLDLLLLYESAKSYGVEERVIFTSPRHEQIQHWMALVPTGQTLLWVGGDEQRQRDYFEQLQKADFAGITQLQIHTRVIDGQISPAPAFLRQAADTLNPYNILLQALPLSEGDKTETYLALLRLGVRSFASDYPDVALQVLRDWSAPKVLLPKEALQLARETEFLEISEGALEKVPEVFLRYFEGHSAAIVVADPITWKVAGERVQMALDAAKIPSEEPFIFDKSPYAGWESVEILENALQRHDAIPIAVGSGVINDLTKLVSHRIGRQYLCVATAASVDGYTAYGASITYQNLKQTFFCPAPIAIVADLDVLKSAPRSSTAAGYADLQAKITSGADWILADTLHSEDIDPMTWNIVQGELADALADPKGAAEGDVKAIRALTQGLMLGGFAMQWLRNSRAASGAEHLFSHLWDMQHHTHNGRAPSHGFKVGIGTLATTALYEFLLEQPFDQLNIDECVANWASREDAIRHARELLGDELAELGEREVGAKYLEPILLDKRLRLLKENWTELKAKLQKQLLPFRELQRRLEAVGAPFEPEQIGISRERLRQSYYLTACIRRRITALDLAVYTDTMDAATEHIFGANGYWSID